MTLATRAPSPLRDLPVVLLEGEEFTPRWEAVAALGRLSGYRVVVVGPGRGDGLVGVEVATGWEATFDGLFGVVSAACAEPWTGGLPLVVAVDATWAWSLLKDRATGLARETAAAKKLLAADPGAVIETPRELWQDAAADFYRLVDVLKAGPVVGVLVADGGADEDGRWAVDAHKGLPRAVSAQVRVHRPDRFRLIGAAGCDPLDDLLPPEHPLDVLLGFLPPSGVRSAQAKDMLLAAVKDHAPDAREACRSIWEALGWDGDPLVPAGDLGAVLADPDAWLPAPVDEPDPDEDPPAELEVEQEPAGLPDRDRFGTVEEWAEHARAQGFGVGESLASDGHDGSVEEDNARPGGTTSIDPTVPVGGDPWDQPREPCGDDDEALRGLEVEGGDDGDGS